MKESVFQNVHHDNSETIMQLKVFAGYRRKACPVPFEISGTLIMNS